MRIHFIAIGGSVMHNLAINLANLGHQITGSDDQIVEPSKSKLKEFGLLPSQIGWDESKITSDLDAIILGKHALADNPELLKAQELNVKIYSFPEFIYEQTLDKIRVVIAGTYGKTTIISMIMHVLKKLGRDFDYLISAKFEGIDSLIKLTPNSSVILMEGDEFYASSIDSHAKFHYYHPNIALISNIYGDNFKNLITEEDYLNLFKDFVETIVPKGTLIYNKEDLNIQKIVNQTKNCKINRHGYQLPQFTINKGITHLQIGDEDIALQVIGKQNLSNISGAYTVCEWLGVTKQDFYNSIKDFKSSIRYLEFVASNDESVVYQDFMYSADRLKSSIHAIKEQFIDRKLLTVIELGVYDVLDEAKMAPYDKSLSESDLAVVFVNKSVIRENNVDTVNINELIINIFNNRELVVINSIADLIDYIYLFDNQDFNMLFVSSSNYNGVNMLSFADKFFAQMK